MPRHLCQGVALALLTCLATVSCNRSTDSAESEQAKRDFAAFRQALIDCRPDRIVAYVPRDVGAYLAGLNSGQSNLPSPGVSLLLRTALNEKVDPELRAHFSLQALLQRLGSKGLLESRNIRDLYLGRVTVNGTHASGELYFQGRLLPLSLPLIKQDQVWKVDLLAMLPYAEVLMRLDRVVTGTTERQQVDRIVAPLPAL